MIEYIKGTVAGLNPACVVIETSGGVAYFLNISLQTFSAVEGKSETKLLVHEVIREDAHTLYGFSDEHERQLFRLLIGVSGVGASTALIILSSLGLNELSTVISTEDVRRLKSVKGIGTKTAERIIVDLKDKIKTANATLSIQDVNSGIAQNEKFEEAHAALLMLGFERKAAEKVLAAIFKEQPHLKVEDAIKQALPKL